jgi:hypothetical protein
VNTNDVERLLREADVEPPAQRIDYERVLARGRRRERRRALARVGGSTLAAIAVAGVVGAVAVAANHSGKAASNTSAAAPAKPPAGAPATTSEPAPGPRTFDPLTQRVSLPWAPPGLTARIVAASADSQTVLAVHPRQDAADEVKLTIWPVGKRPAAGGCQRGARTGDIQGQPAYLLVEPRRPANGGWPVECVGLTWQQPDGSWVQVATRDFGPVPATPASRANRLTIARHAAESARFDQPAPVREPFTVSGALRQLSLTGTAMWLAPAGAPDFTGGYLTLTNPANHRSILVGCVATDATSNRKLPPANTTIDGHPATDSAGVLAVYQVGGCRIDVQGDPAAVAGARTLTDAYRLVHPVSHPADPSTWTTQPLG